METPLSAGIEAVDLENTPEFQALVVAAAGKPERAMGDSVIPAEPPQWTDVLSKAQDLIQQPPHLAVLVYLIKASCHVRGFAGLQETLASVADALESQWDAILPLADPDDPDDPHYARVNLLRELSDDPDFTNRVYRQPMVDVRGVGAFSARDIDISRGSVTGTEEETARCKDGLIRGAMQETGAEALRELAAAMQSVQDSCSRINASFDQHAGSSHGLSMGNLSNRLASCHAALVEMSGGLLDEVNPSDEQPVDEELPQAGATGNGHAAAEQDTASRSPGASSRLSSRDEVVQALDQVIAYYRRFEPSSPVPILAQHARDMVPKSFFDIVQVLAPGGNNFGACIETLIDRPIAFLLEESYQRYTAGGGENGNNLSIEAPGQDANLSHSGSQPGAPIDSRSDVIDTLNDIELFFVQTEPASPIPLVIVEMKKMVQKTFAQIVADFSQSLRVNEAAPAAEEG